MTRTFVIIINGVPQSGKDTFCDLCKKYVYCDGEDNVITISSVDPIKDMLYKFGWDGKKSDEVRDLIADIKQLWMKSTEPPTFYLFDQIFQYHKTHQDQWNTIFVHIREPEEIKKLTNILSGLNVIGIEWHTILVRRKNGDLSNKRTSDNFNIITSYPYGTIIDNDGTIDDLDNKAMRYVDWLYDEDRISYHNT